MRTFLAALTLAAFSAWAGETFIGNIYVSDGGTVSNATTGYGSAGCAYSTTSGPACATDQAFPIGANVKLTLQPDSACCVSVNRATTDGGICTGLTAGQLFPTSTGQAVTTTQSDGGTYTGGIVSITATPSCRLRVFTRSGTE